MTKASSKVRPRMAEGDFDFTPMRRRLVSRIWIRHHKLVEDDRPSPADHLKSPSSPRFHLPDECDGNRLDLPTFKGSYWEVNARKASSQQVRFRVTSCCLTLVHIVPIRRLTRRTVLSLVLLQRATNLSIVFDHVNRSHHIWRANGHSTIYQDHRACLNNLTAHRQLFSQNLQ